MELKYIHSFEELEKVIELDEFSAGIFKEFFKRKIWVYALYEDGKLDHIKITSEEQNACKKKELLFKNGVFMTGLKSIYTENCPSCEHQENCPAYIYHDANYSSLLKRAKEIQKE